MKIRNILIIGVSMFALAGCKSLFGTYERPEINTSGLMRDVASATDTLVVSDTTSFGNLEWRSST